MPGTKVKYWYVYICILQIVFELRISEKKKEERSKMKKLKLSYLVFSTLRKVGRTYRVDLAIEYVAKG